MKKIFLLLLIFFALTGCVKKTSQPCEFCGKWYFDKFEYDGYITTDCENTAEKLYTNSVLKLTLDKFCKINNINHSMIETDNVIINMKEIKYNEEYKLTIKKDKKVIESFYFILPDTLYQNLDGCKFYFKRK